MANLTGMLFKRHIDIDVGPGESPTLPPGPTYSVTPAAYNVNEGDSLTFNVTGTDITDGTYYWTVSNSGDFVTSSGSFAISNGAGSFSGSFSVTPTADTTTEGAETFTASVRTGSITGTIVATSSTVTINDTSTGAIVPTYTVTPAASNVNEGASLTFNVSGTNIVNGTYYWTITNSGDFGTSSGLFTITSNTGSFNVTPTADATTEGAETFTASVRTSSTSGTIVVTSSTVTINDTSTTPSPSPSPSPVLEGAGAVWTSGSNPNGELGDNTQIAKVSPVQTVAGGTNWKQVSGGLRQSFAIKTDGTLWAWGLNNYGQFGDNSITSRLSPVQTGNGETTWVQISAGRGHSVAIKIDGTIWTWGNNGNGQLGRSAGTASAPYQVTGGGTNWKQCSAGNYHCAAIKTNGTLWTWGNNGGKLGDNTTTQRNSPVQTISGGTNWEYVSAGSEMTVAIKTDGTLWTWGGNGNGELGDGTNTGRLSPVQTIAGGSNWDQVSCGWWHTVAIKTDGTLWSWGANSAGQLGDNTAISKSSPVQIVTGGTNWQQVAGGYQQTRAIKTDGTLWGWGANSVGQLGDNTVTKRSSPVQTVAGGSNWKQVASGAHHSLMIRG